MPMHHNHHDMHGPSHEKPLAFCCRIAEVIADFYPTALGLQASTFMSLELGAHLNFLLLREELRGDYRYWRSSAGLALGS